jgi:high frequency lysogenization protein
MPQTNHDRVIALAGLFQAVVLVKDIAQTGQVDAADFSTCIDSVFKVDAKSSEDVYDGLSHLRTGLTLLIAQLQNPTNIEITRYAVALLVLERKLNKSPGGLREIGEGIKATTEKLQFFPPTHDNIIASLAEIYATSISCLTPRIMVNGEQAHLTKPENANRIRALLLAGIRAARLWRQNGGGRFTLLFRRKPLLFAAHQCLAALEQPA